MGNQKILVACDQAEQQKVSTVIHEIIEALNYHLNMRLEHNAISSLESGLYQAMEDAGVDLSSLHDEAASP